MSDPSARLAAAAAAAKQRQQEQVYLAKARAKSAAMKGFFDDDEDDEQQQARKPPPPLGRDDDDEEDPLEAFMRANPLRKDDDDDDDDDAGFVGRAPKRPRTAMERDNAAGGGGKKGQRKEEQEVDPLDAFMAGVQDKVKEESTTLGAKGPPEKPMFLDAASDEEEDEGGYLGADRRGLGGEGEEDEEYDSDAEVYNAGAEAAEKARMAALAEGELGAGAKYSRVGPDGKKAMEVLPPLDHAAISYAPFRKAFYQEKPELAALPWPELQAYRDELGVQATGRDVPRPIRSFTEAGFGDTLLKEIVKRGFEAPTAIQAQALPAVLSGRDVIGIAKTGSGKTLAFVWPAVVHLMDQHELEPGDGPIVLILAPTRELASQIYVEASKFAKPHGAKVAAVFGGAGKWEQTKLLKEGVEILVATPGRLIEMIKTKATNMRRCTLLVLDEADRMFDMGFEAQIRSVIGQIRPDRQTLLFSATFKKRVERLAQEALRDPMRIVVGTAGQANEDIRQEVLVLKDNSEKWGWLSANLSGMAAAGKVLVFVSSKQGCEELAANLSKQGVAGSIKIEAIHGDRDQHDRSLIMRRFKQGETPILVATDVASRGLDIKDVNTVCNYDVAKSIEIHVHRIGRTGRMGVDGVHPGTAFTLVTQKDANFAHDLIRNLEMSKQVVPPALRALAARAPRGSGGGGGGGGGGSSFSRAGIGAAGFGPASHHQPGHHHAKPSGVGAGGGGGGYRAVPPPSQAGATRGGGGIAFVRPADAANREHHTVGGAGAGGEAKRKSRWG